MGCEFREPGCENLNWTFVCAIEYLRSWVCIKNDTLTNDSAEDRLIVNKMQHNWINMGFKNRLRIEIKPKQIGNGYFVVVTWPADSN